MKMRSHFLHFAAATIVGLGLLSFGSPAAAQAAWEVKSSPFDLGYDRNSAHFYRLFIDVNGDGRADYCRVLGDGEQFRCALATESRTWVDAASSPRIIKGWPESRRWGDLDGDGRPEFCRLHGDENQPLTWFCNAWADGAWTQVSSLTLQLFRPDDYTTYDGNLIGRGPGQPGLISRSHVDVVDVDGDGRSDFCYVYSGNPSAPTGTTMPDELRCHLYAARQFPLTGSDFTPQPTRTFGPIDSGNWWGQKWPKAWVDVDGDGLSDYCRIVGSGPYYVRCTLNGSTGFRGEITSPAIDPGEAEGAAFVDFNGDGKADYCRVIGTQLRCLLSMGNGWSTSWDIAAAIGDAGYRNARWWVDVNGDGMADYCRATGAAPASGTTTLSCRMSRGDSFSPVDVVQWISSAGHEGTWSWCDATGDGFPEYCRVTGNNGSGTIHAGWEGAVVARPQVVVEFGNGLGAVTKVAYRPLTASDTYTRGGFGGWPRALIVQPTSFVVRETRVVTTDGRALAGRSLLHYEQLRTNTEGRGSIGFARRWAVNEGNNSIELTEYFQGLADGQGSRADAASFNEYGQVRRSQRFFVRNAPVWSQIASSADWRNSVINSDRLLVNETENTLVDLSPTPNPGYRYVGTSVTRTWDINPSQQRVELPTVTTTTAQDAFGNATSLVKVTSHLGAEWGRETTTNVFDNFTTPWILGRLKKSTVEHRAPAPADQLARFATSSGTSPLATANTYTPPSAQPPMPPANTAALMAIIQMLLLDD